MALVNRDKDGSEQRDIWNYNSNAVIGVSVALNLFVAPCASQLLAIQVAAYGLSSTPTLNFNIQRFVVGAGVTTLATGFTALAVGAAYGTSGALAVITPLTAGSTLVQLQKGDVVQCITSTANSAASYTMDVVTQTLQDIKQTYGV